MKREKPVVIEVIRIILIHRNDNCRNVIVECRRNEVKVSALTARQITKHTISVGIHRGTMWVSI